MAPTAGRDRGRVREAAALVRLCKVLPQQVGRDRDAASLCRSGERRCSSLRWACPLSPVNLGWQAWRG
jgi:hypothetical protein